MTETSVHGLTVVRSGVNLFQDFSLDFESGKTTALLAPSGAGKTTLLDCVAALLAPDDGSVSAPERISYLFQEPRLVPWYSIRRNVELPLVGILPPTEAADRAEYFISQVGLLEKSSSLPSRCSGGERQRAALARAFAYPSRLLLMDEAFQSQDFALKIRLMELTQRLLSEERRTVLLVTHDVREAVCLSDRLVVLGGRPVRVLLDVPGLGSDKPIHGRYVSPDRETLTLESEVMSRLCAQL